MYLGWIVLGIIGVGILAGIASGQLDWLVKIGLNIGIGWVVLQILGAILRAIFPLIEPSQPHRPQSRPHRVSLTDHQYVGDFRAVELTRDDGEKLYATGGKGRVSLWRSTRDREPFFTGTDQEAAQVAEQWRQGA